MKEIKSKGDAQAEEYVDKVIEKGEIPVTNTISRNNFYTLQNRPPAVLDKKRKQGCKNPTAIVTRYFLCIKDRSESEKEDYFQHESVQEPPSISKNGQLYTGRKATMIDCLISIPRPGKNNLRNRATIAALDMAAVIHMVKPGTKDT